ncbi:MAG: nucleotide exchange factor GrpE [Lachnospiraceae bacterium]|nr:nucleotide exchange factor GrpE [Lachnospiraceae bacterium]
MPDVDEELKQDTADDTTIEDDNRQKDNKETEAAPDSDPKEEDIASSEEVNEDDKGSEEAENADEEESAETGSDESESAESTEEDPKEKKKGSRWKKDKKDKRDEQIEELKDRVKRQMAEFENFRKRTDKEKSSMYEMGAKSVIEKILPVIDNFERGLCTVPEEEKTKGFAEGMDKIYKQLLTELENLGVKPIEAVGKEFDPNFHNAVMQVESEEYDTGVVAQELQKGYMFRDSVVRHSMVAVVK